MNTALLKLRGESPFGWNRWKFLALAILAAGVGVIIFGCGPQPGTNESPVALFALDWLDNLALDFDASSSFDPDGEIILYEWDFGDGAREASPFPKTHHRYGPGTYLVSLSVTDNDGSSTDFYRDIFVVPEKNLEFGTISRDRAGTLYNWPPIPVLAYEFVIRSQAEWERLREHFPLSFPSLSLPDIDFNKEIAIFVCLGQKNNANDHVRITKVMAAGGKLTVYYQELIPAPGCLIMPRISYPFHIIKTERVDLPAMFLKEVATNPNCY